MKQKVGYLISHKNSEKRRALLPVDLQKLHYLEHMVFEREYGAALGIPDKEYEKAGAQFASREEVLQSDVLVDVKLGDSDFMDEIGEGKILCGWAHSVQKTDFTGKVIRGKHTVIAWENIFESGRYIFWRNREVAGEAAVLQAFQYCGKMPYDCRVAVIGNGQTAKGAMFVLMALGAQVEVFGRKYEKTFRAHMADFDMIVNCVMWDTNRTDRLIYRSDLEKLKAGSMIIDVSCDPALEIETSRPTTINDPVYTVDNIIHYAVDNTPSMFPITVSKIISEHYARYADYLVSGDYPENLRAAIDVESGKILNPAIIDFRKSRNLFCE